MLYKVTPNLTPQPVEKPAKDPNAPKIARKRRKSAVYDCDGNEVLITMMCLKCRAMKPLVMFGLRKMADGAIRNQPWCRSCRSGAGVKKPKDADVEAAAEAALAADAVEAPANLEAEQTEALETAADAEHPPDAPATV
jgi:hypothetical protein